MPAAVYAEDSFGATTRHRTPEGFLRAAGAITQPGVVTYDAAELGGAAAELGIAPDGAIRVRRTPESVYAPETLASVRGAVLTLDHPAADVSPANYRDLAVGSVVGEPTRSADDRLTADLLVADQGAISALEAGTRELSIGYGMRLVATPDDPEADAATVGPLAVNHLALVDAGRAGSTIRVFDSSRRTTVPDPTPAPPTASDIAGVIVSTLRDAGVLPAPGRKDAPDDAAIRRVVDEKIAPILDEQRKVADSARRAEAQKKADAALAEVRDAARKEERQRSRDLAMAAKVLSADRLDKLAEADSRAILVAAVGDSLGDPAPHSEDYLRGALRVQVAATETRPPRPSDPGTPHGGVGIDRGAEAVNDAWQKATAQLVDLHLLAPGETIS